MNKAELLATWRDAVRQAELAERLVTAATEAASEADARESVSTEIAHLAEEAAVAATRAAERAAAAAKKASALAKSLHENHLAHAVKALDDARNIEKAAKAAYNADDSS